VKESDRNRAEREQRAEEEDDLFSFGSLSPPDQEAGASAQPPEATEADLSEADLAALATSVAAEEKNGLHGVDSSQPEDDSTIDLRAAAAASDDEEQPGGSMAEDASPAAAGVGRQPAPAQPAASQPAAPQPAAPQPPAVARPRPVLPLVLASFALGLGAGAAIFLGKSPPESDAGNNASPAATRVATTEPESAARAADNRVSPPLLSLGEPPRAVEDVSASRPAGVNDPVARTPEATAIRASTASAPIGERANGSSAHAPGGKGARLGRKNPETNSSETREGRNAAPEADRYTADKRAAEDKGPAEDKEAAEDPGTDSAGVIDELLDETLEPEAGKARAGGSRTGGRAKGAGPGEGTDLPEGSGLPLTPSRQQVTDAIKVLLPAIRGCAMGRAGLATANIVIRNDGRVASVSVRGDGFAGSPSGRCMEGAIRKARFPAFRQKVFRVTYPLSIQGAARDNEIPR
jgi:hypothetical protein